MMSKRTSREKLTMERHSSCNLSLANIMVLTAGLPVEAWARTVHGVEQLEHQPH